MKWLWIIICLVTGVLTEIGVSTYGLVLPLTVVLVHYLAVVFGWRTLLVPALLGGAWLDIIYGRRPGATLAVMVAALLVATVWRRQGNCRHLVAQAAPGAVQGAVSLLILFTSECLLVERPTWGLLWHGCRMGLQFLGGAALLVPLLCLVLDHFAKRLGLPQYRQVQQQPQSHVP